MGYKRSFYNVIVEDLKDGQKLITTLIRAYLL